MICFVRYTDNRTGTTQMKSFPSSLLRAMWIVAWTPYVTILKEWEEE